MILTNVKHRLYLDCMVKQLGCVVKQLVCVVKQLV